VESFHQNYVVIFQTTILKIVGFYVRHSVIDLQPRMTIQLNGLFTNYIHLQGEEGRCQGDCREETRRAGAYKIPISA
jgi:hypothetical protein